ncbi:DegT/DnrJ/EryC1/StrS family aminotransferase [Streptomyces sp. TRM70350]|uniref:DegT/DnrJ/EryC1/StrS aminotransferase family protein n=1 Tax=Streptomyces sp. TRM70350 TaxID=2856165 RepID=UPI001C45D18B|nr:DegT/DnrJ/EryC1/StrS family aminotransferase [Streptomyces sp. TRM70350]MBV7700849.1 DegT/DnrJ/EryC1/StrS family aminotransferase [Streptomyces sp. TRM70350]
MRQATRSTARGRTAGSYAVPAASRGSVLGREETEALAALLSSRAALSSGEQRERFEERFARHVGTRYALSVTSGTVALELALHLLDLREGDEVVATPQTYQATVQPLLGSPARVRFCDVDPDSLNVDPVRLAELVTDRTRAIVLVHYGGWPADMDRVMALARERGITVVEDCAHALGSSYRGRRPGSLGDLGCFSFHSSKNITSLGEGGMITFDREEWAPRLDRLRSNEPDGLYTGLPEPADGVPDLLPWMKYSSSVYRTLCEGVRRPGTNATLSEAACAVGLVQLKRLEELVARRRAIAARLDAVLERHPQCRVPRPGAGLEHAYHLYTFFVTERQGVREKLVRGLDERGVEVELRYFPMHLTPEWRARGHDAGECPVAERLWFGEHVNLPCHPGLTDAQVDHLVWALDDALASLTAG